jgi:hypothetical protein
MCVLLSEWETRFQTHTKQNIHTCDCYDVGRSCLCFIAGSPVPFPVPLPWWYRPIGARSSTAVWWSSNLVSSVGEWSSSAGGGGGGGQIYKGGAVSLRPPSSPQQPPSPGADTHPPTTASSLSLYLFSTAASSRACFSPPNKFSNIRGGDFNFRDLSPSWLNPTNLIGRAWGLVPDLGPIPRTFCNFWDCLVTAGVIGAERVAAGTGSLLGEYSGPHPPPPLSDTLAPEVLSEISFSVSGSADVRPFLACPLLSDFFKMDFERRCWSSVGLVLLSMESTDNDDLLPPSLPEQKNTFHSERNFRTTFDVLTAMRIQVRGLLCYDAM